MFLSFLNITTAPVYDPFISSLPSVHSQKVSISFYPCVTLKKLIFHPTLVCTVLSKSTYFVPL